MKNTNFPAGVKPNITAVITQADGTTIELANSDFLAGSVSFNSGSSNSGEITVGGAIIPSFKFSLMNETSKFSDVNFVNATVKPTITANNITLEMGKYWFVNHKETGNIISCESYGALQIFDEHQLYEDEITYPMSANSLASKIISGRGFSYGGGGYAFINVDDPEDDDMTERECLAYIAQMFGCFVKEYTNGDTTYIRFESYKKSVTPIDAGTTFSHDLRTEPITVTGIQVYAKDSDTPVERGSDGYRLVIQDNPFITESNIEAVADRIDSIFTGLSFYPGTYSILGNPAIEPGDMLKVQTDKKEIITLATTVTYKLQLQESITADADDYAGDMRLSKKARAKQYVDRQIANAVEKGMNNMMSDPDSTWNQELGGIHDDIDGINDRLDKLEQSSGSSAELEAIHLPNGETVDTHICVTYLKTRTALIDEDGNVDVVTGNERVLLFQEPKLATINSVNISLISGEDWFRFQKIKDIDSEFWLTGSVAYEVTFRLEDNSDDGGDSRINLSCMGIVRVSHSIGDTRLDCNLKIFLPTSYFSYLSTALAGYLVYVNDGNKGGAVIEIDLSDDDFYSDLN